VFETKADYHLFAIADGLEDTAAAVLASEMAIDTIKMNLKKGNGKGKERFVVKSINSGKYGRSLPRRNLIRKLFNMQRRRPAVVLEKDFAGNRRTSATAVCTASGTGARRY